MYGLCELFTCNYLRENDLSIDIRGMPNNIFREAQKWYQIGRLVEKYNKVPNPTNEINFYVI